jgi:[ribosomal protein S5]-alanine N-acetyltransferase
MLKLVKYSEKHINFLIENLNNRNITKWLFVIPDPYTVDEAGKWIKFCKENDDKNDNYLFAVEENEIFIGGIGLHKKMEHCFDVGYWISEKQWGKGYATEALKILTDMAFNKLKIDRIQGFVFDGNTASEKVLEKCGYEYEGYLKKSHKKGEVFYNSKLYAKIN